MMYSYEDLREQCSNVERGYDRDMANGVEPRQALETLAYSTLGILKDLLHELEES